MDFGERLKEARENLGFNQNEFAEKLQLAPQSLARYEKNKVKPTIEFIEKLTNMFIINSNWLINGKGSMFVKNDLNFSFKEETIKNLDLLNENQIKYIYHLTEAEKIKNKGF